MVRTVARMMLVGVAIVAGCASAPRTRAAKIELDRRANEALQAMLSKDPSIRPLIDQSVGYIVFPAVKEGGFIAGGAGAEGVIFEHGRRVGYATLSRGELGALAGGQKYAELVAVKDQATLNKIRAGNFDFGAQASAVIIKAGVASSTNFTDKGVAVFMDPIGGAMVNASVTGQRIKTTM